MHGAADMLSHAAPPICPSAQGLSPLLGLILAFLIAASMDVGLGIPLTPIGGGQRAFHD